MTQKLLLQPKHVIPEEYKDRKVFFLAGPIRGGGAWQMQAAETLWKKFPGCIVVDPSRWDAALKNASDDEEKKRISEHMENGIGIKDEQKYESQAAWESDHMKMAAEKGILLFWMERESKENPRPKDEGVYAQDTRVETGIWIERLHNNPTLNVKFGGHWELNDKGQETENSFGGMNFIAYYLTGVQDRKKLLNGEVEHPNLVIAKDLNEFIEKATRELSENREIGINKIPMK